MKLTVTIDEADFIRDLIERAANTNHMRGIKEATQGSKGMSAFYFQLTELCDDLAGRIKREIYSAKKKGDSDGQRL